MTERLHRRQTEPYLLEIVRLTCRDRIDTLGMRQVSLAARVGITEKHMSQILSGATMGSWDVWGRVMDHLGLEMTVRPVSGR